MVNREKRLVKGIGSIEKQIEIHRQKQASAIEKGQIELAEYYHKEIESFIKVKIKKEKQLEKAGNKR